MNLPRPNEVTFFATLACLILALAFLVNQLISQLKNKEAFWGTSSNPLKRLFDTPHSLNKKIIVAFAFLTILCFVLAVGLMLLEPIVPVNHEPIPPTGQPASHAPKTILPAAATRKPIGSTQCLPTEPGAPPVRKTT